jgi:hypothetical protein
MGAYKDVEASGMVGEKGGVAATAASELAVHCHSCPIDSINLPPNWDQCPPLLQYDFLSSIHILLYVTDITA